MKYEVRVMPDSRRPGCFDVGVFKDSALITLIPAAELNKNELLTRMTPLIGILNGQEQEIAKLRSEMGEEALNRVYGRGAPASQRIGEPALPSPGEISLPEGGPPNLGEAVTAAAKALAVSAEALGMLSGRLKGRMVRPGG